MPPGSQLDGPEIEFDLLDVFGHTLFVLLTTAASVGTAKVQQRAVRNVLLDGTPVRVTVDVDHAGLGRLTLGVAHDSIDVLRGEQRFTLTGCLAPVNGTGGHQHDNAHNPGLCDLWRGHCEVRGEQSSSMGTASDRS